MGLQPGGELRGDAVAFVSGDEELPGEPGDDSAETGGAWDHDALLIQGGEDLIGQPVGKLAGPDPTTAAPRCTPTAAPRQPPSPEITTQRKITSLLANLGQTPLRSHRRAYSSALTRRITARARNGGIIGAS